MFCELAVHDDEVFKTLTGFLAVGRLRREFAVQNDIAMRIKADHALRKS